MVSQGGDDDLDDGPSSIGEDGGMPEPRPSANSFPRANIAGTGHYDHAIDRAASTPFSHEGGGVKSYGREHPQNRGGRMRGDRADRDGDAGSPLEHGIAEGRMDAGDGGRHSEMPKNRSMRGGRMRGDRAESHGDAGSPIEHGIAEGRQEERGGGKFIGQGGRRGRR